MLVINQRDQFFIPHFPNHIVVSNSQRQPLSQHKTTASIFLFFSPMVDARRALTSIVLYWKHWPYCAPLYLNLYIIISFLIACFINHIFPNFCSWGYHFMHAPWLGSAATPLILLSSRYNAWYCFKICFLCSPDILMTERAYLQTFANSNG